MKNVSILSKLFLVSALMIPCGQAFAMKGALIKGAMKGTAQEIKVELGKQGFWQRPVVKGALWGTAGFTGAALYNALMKVCHKEEHSLSAMSIGVSTLVPGVFGYVRGLITLNGRNIKQVLRNQKTLKLTLEAFRRLQAEDMKKLDERNSQRVRGLENNQKIIRDGVDLVAKKVEAGNVNELQSIELQRWLSDVDNQKRLQDMMKKILQEQDAQQKKSGWFGWGRSKLTLGLL